MRDAISEAAFFQTYGNMFSMYLADEGEAGAERRRAAGGRARAAAGPGGARGDRRGRLRRGADADRGAVRPPSARELPLERIALKKELVGEYRDLLPDLPADEWRRIRGRQDIIVRYAPEQALATLPRLLADPADRERLLTLLERLFTDPRLADAQPSPEQRALLARMADVLEVSAARRRWIGRTRKAGAGRRPAAPRKPAAAR